jgi:hypothetical protein
MGARVSRLPLLWGLATAGVIYLLAYYCYRVYLGGIVDFMPGDHLVHLQIARGTNGTAIPHPLYHYAVSLAMELTGDGSFDGARRCAALVLALAAALKGWLTYRELYTSMDPREAAITCFALSVAMSLPVWWKFPNIYLDQIHSNIWHNPTAPFAVPFALVMFLAGMSYWDAPGLGKALTVGVSAALCALAKPNYLLAFFPCFGPLLLVLVGRQVWRRQLPISSGLAHLVAAFAAPLWVLAAQFFYMFGDKQWIGIAPFQVWGSPNIPASLAVSLAFPLTVLLCYFRATMSDRRVLFAWCVLWVAIAEFALLAEEPETRLINGNFVWATLPACYMLFMECCRLVARQPTSPRTVACSVVLALHAASGTMFLFRSLITPGDSWRF